VSSLLALIILCLALVIVAIPLVGGGEWRTVQTGSMEPQTSPGDVVLLTPMQRSPGVGDVVAFRDPLQPDRDVLHRVVGFADSGALLTKGDANDVADPWQIGTDEVIGEQRLTIPKVGILVQGVSSDIGIFFFLVVPSLLILVNESRVWYRFVRYGSEAVGTPARGRHLTRGGTHPKGSPA
jgi:signal peptidase